jgi:hypothetical protein
VADDRSIEDYERRRKCWLRGCSQEKEDGPFCADHASELPEDLLYRIRWAYDNGDTMDWLAAIRAAAEYLRGT